MPYLNAGTYLNEDHHAYVKDKEIQMGDLLEATDLPSNARVLDIGCATGALIGYLGKRFPGWRLVGVEPGADMVDVARTRVPEAEFHVGTAGELSKDWKGKFDAVISTGVIGIFDEQMAQDSLDEMIFCTRTGGTICVLHNFNDYDADVLVRHRKRLDGVLGDWETTWNIYSEATVREWLAGKVESVSFVPFDLSVDQEPKPDPSRTFTFKDDKGRRRITNGLRLLMNLQYLIAQTKKND